jgi:hypothetical protein
MALFSAGLLANACSLNPQPLPPDQPTDASSGFGSAPQSAVDGGVNTGPGQPDATIPAVDSGAIPVAQDGAASPDAGAGPDTGGSSDGGAVDAEQDGSDGGEDAPGDASVAADAACSFPAGFLSCPDPADGGGPENNAATWNGAKAAFFADCLNGGRPSPGSPVDSASACAGYEVFATSPGGFGEWTYYDVTGKLIANAAYMGGVGCQAGVFPAAVGCPIPSPLSDPTCVPLACPVTDASTEASALQDTGAVAADAAAACTSCPTPVCGLGSASTR